MNVTVNLSFQDSLLTQLDQVARSESRSRSELIREAARMYIERKRQWNDIFTIGDKTRCRKEITPEVISTEISAHRKGQ
ncbi:MAG: ribbon-helix-helix domain-containing protein [Phycisphaerae bacterium]|nr:ribbon-helix-helix domain-containing protein [Phycisphaerae bacterium]